MAAGAGMVFFTTRREVDVAPERSDKSGRIKSFSSELSDTGPRLKNHENSSLSPCASGKLARKAEIDPKLHKFSISWVTRMKTPLDDA
jgi:hypothetical protein